MLLGVHIDKDLTWKVHVNDLEISYNFKSELFYHQGANLNRPNFYQSTFKFMGTQVYNSLPREIRDIFLGIPANMHACMKRPTPLMFMCQLCLNHYDIDFVVS